MRDEIPGVLDYEPYMRPLVPEREEVPPDAICLPGTEGRVWVRVSAVQMVRDQSPHGVYVKAVAGEHCCDCSLAEVLKALGWA